MSDLSPTPSPRDASVVTMADEQSSSPKLNSGELAKLLSPVPKGCLIEEDIISYDGPHIWVTHRNGHVEPLAEQPQESPPATNGTRSESLTRLQDGYLKAIAALEDRNESLQQDLNIAQPYCANTAQRATYFEQQNGYLQLELGAARATPDARKAHIVQLEATLAAKNTRIKEKNSQIIRLEQNNRRLEEELKAERSKNKVGGESRRMVPAVGQTSWDRRGIGANGGGKALKKRKLVEFVREGDYDKAVRGGKEDPRVID